MINKDELIYKLEAIIEYLKNNGGYDYELYNILCLGIQQNMQKMYYIQLIY